MCLLEFYKKLAYNKRETHTFVLAWWVRILHVETKLSAFVRTFFHAKVTSNQTVLVGHLLHTPLTTLSLFLCVSVFDFFSC